MKYTEDEVATMARIVMSAKLHGDHRAQELVVTIAALTGMSESDVWRKISDMASRDAAR